METAGSFRAGRRLWKAGSPRQGECGMAPGRATARARTPPGGLLVKANAAWFQGGRRRRSWPRAGVAARAPCRAPGRSMRPRRSALRGAWRGSFSCGRAKAESVPHGLSRGSSAPGVRLSVRTGGRPLFEVKRCAARCTPSNGAHTVSRGRSTRLRVVLPLRPPRSKRPFVASRWRALRRHALVAPGAGRLLPCPQMPCLRDRCSRLGGVVTGSYSAALARSACGRSGKPMASRWARNVSATRRARARTRPMKRWRSVTLMAPRASSTLNW